MGGDLQFERYAAHGRCMSMSNLAKTMPVTEATPFACPTCSAQYKLVRVETNEILPDQQLTCRLPLTPRGISGQSEVRGNTVRGNPERVGGTRPGHPSSLQLLVAKDAPPWHPASHMRVARLK
jgi:hypothetical protein